MELIYTCKKNGLDYVYSTAIEFTAPQDAYAWRKGVREYADNYHASLSLKNKKGERVWAGTDAEFVAEVGKYCDEALARFQAGDVPSERGTADPATTEARKMATALRASGVSMDEFNAALAAAKATKEKAEKKKAA